MYARILLATVGEGLVRAERLVDGQWDVGIPLRQQLVRSLAADPLCSIGAHTVHHFALARLDTEQARKEAVSSRDRIAASSCIGTCCGARSRK